MQLVSMREGWVTKELGDLLDRSTDRLGSRPEPRILTVTEGAGIVDQLQHWGRRVATEDVSSYKLVRPGDVAYNVYLLWNGAIGQNTFSTAGITSPVYEVFRPRDSVEPDFIGLLLETPSLRECYDAISIGTVPRRRRAPWQDFLKLRVSIPPLDQQCRIVDLIGALDKTIVAAQLAQQNNLYTVVLEKMGAQFDSVALGKVVTKAFAGGTPARNNPSFYGGEIPWLKSGEVENDAISSTSESITPEGLSGSAARMVSPGSTVVAMYGQGETKGRAGRVVTPLTTNQAVLALVPDPDKINQRFLLHAVRSRTASLRSRAVGAAQPNLSKALAGVSWLLSGRVVLWLVGGGVAGGWVYDLSGGGGCPAV